MHMADIFGVIADATRRDILKLLLDRAAMGEDGTSVSQIVQVLGVSQPTISKHLKVLREAGLVAVREEGQHRFYRLSRQPLDEVDDWLVPFFDDGTDVERAIAMAPALPDGAVHAAEAVGRAAASVGHVVSSALRKLGG